MPYGYTSYMEREGYSTETITSYVKTVRAFFSYIDMKYEKSKEVFEITPKDIKTFIDSCLSDGHSKMTCNKYLSILKSFFDYLWQKDKIAADPTVKIKRYVLEDTKKTEITYQQLLDILPDILSNPTYSSLRKAIYVLTLKGLRHSEFQFIKENVIDMGDSVTIKLKKHEINLTHDAAETFMSYYFESQFNGTPYVFITKKHDSSLVPIEVMSLYTHINAISKDYGLPTKLNLNMIRHAYAYYLYKVQRHTIENISTILGIKPASAAQLVKISLDRYQ
ncbi:site-specific integrase [Anaerobacillus sp. 1_MG-2023]|uniref:tyrosine-type recombinase/integrase n=1 Tax=Anaerobacillus sp. 1_MG-2023 TaxID=3062655 RepID=UPI0026E3DA99|nr:site-specific integrase [Anaerobacillus sp. 1_MG-2023]MDO6657401.1 phage integrase N-terminal SAM-like domain-containing protein [Anaerobacillus sp. 1_MG-2023]